MTVTPALRKAAPVGAVLALAATLRLWSLDRQGLLLFDEGQLILEARGTRALAAACAGAVAGRTGARDLLRAEVANCRIVFGKPAHNVLLAGILAAEGRADRATLLLSAVAGTLTVLVVWDLGRVLWGPAVGLLAALLLAVSPYHLLYSREGLSDALTVLGWTGALAAFARPGRVMSALSGLLAGLAVTTNYRMLFMPFLFALLSAFPPAGGAAGPCRSGWRDRFLPWLAGFLTPFVVFESGWCLLLALAQGARPPAGTYAGQLEALLSYHGAQGFLFRGWTAFGWYVARWEGPLSLAVLIAVLPFQAAGWRGAGAFANLALLAPWLLFSAYWDNASRFFAVLLPLVAVIKARWLLSAGTAVACRLPRWTAAALPLAAAASLLPPALAMVPRPTPYLAATELLIRSGDPRHISTDSRLGQAYAAAGACVQMPPDWAEVRSRSRAGWRWAVTDLQAFFGGFDRPEDRIAVAGRIAASCPSVLDVPYSPLALDQFVLEQDLSFQDARALLAELRRQGPRLRVFDLWGKAGPGFSGR